MYLRFLLKVVALELERLIVEVRPKCAYTVRDLILFLL